VTATGAPAKNDAEQLENILRGIETEPPDAVRTRERNAFDELAGPLRDRLVLFGAGPLGKTVLTGLRKAGVEPLAFADNRVGVERRLEEQKKEQERRRAERRIRGDRGKVREDCLGMSDSGVQNSVPSLSNQGLPQLQIMGLPVLSAAEAVERYGKTACFVVTIYQGTSVRRQLASLGCERVVACAPLLWKYSNIFIPQCGLELPHRFREQCHSIRQCYAMLADEASKRELRDQLVWRYWLDFSALSPPLDASYTYYPMDLLSPVPDEVFVDCGSFDGESTKSFARHWGGTFRHVFALEPDPLNQKALGTNLEAMGIGDRVTVMPYAVGSSNGQVSFAGSGSVTSHVTNQDGGFAVECRRLDDIEWPVTPTYIKMDIESAEPEALAGATELLRRHKPVLAVCTYHRNEHLWQIPNLIHSIAPEYHVFLRRYAEECWEGVCYAIPPHRLKRA
jgi:FkbM family methyltransferase